MQALIQDKTNHTAVVKTIPIPTPLPDELLVRVKAIALNPVDALYVAHPIAQSDGRVVGSDFAGVVEALGAGVVGWQIGDRIAAFVQGACSTNDRPGSFAEYATTPADLAFKIPSNTSFEHAAALPLCALTSAQALFLRLGLPAPFPIPVSAPAVVPLESSEANPAVLIYGASTTLGLLALSLLKLCRTSSGAKYRVFGTAGKTNHALLRERGIDGVVDYRDPNWVDEIVKLSGGISAAFDCISEGTTTGNVSRTFIPAGGKIAVIRGAAWDAKLVREGVHPAYGAVWSGLGVEIGYNGAILPALPDSRVFSGAFYRFLASGNGDNLPIDGPALRIMPGGLGAIVRDGFELLGSGTVGGRTGGKGRDEAWMKPISAEKLVYRI
ncbi:hypothetical protein FRB94_006578 [Tulasnella sp. JGI-2019a]|nr:hypothetical protein FRB93_012081 [Tulasnella sp. JGI-2019a]KAG9012210.1 hypothetical protein FRB94_006578 [Tulasnella sp. JGI-2019a]